ncbi:hypothetical protein [Acetomicrobium sp.]|uniref:baeRF10 domain-containing protein n=1 Tax=Acetomicrobium sp. TaxID=1872099 RepID=UPI001BCBE099|nr:hypothetical protein [Acetomicrobium sp.]
MFEDVVKGLLRECEGKPFLMSLYVDCDRAQRSAKEILIDLKNLQKKASEEVKYVCGDANCKQCNETIASLFNELSDELSHGGFSEAKGVSCFADLHGDYRRFIGLPILVVNKIKFLDHPFLAPLVEALSPHKLALAAVVEARRATFFRVYASSVDKLMTLEEDVPPKVKSAGWYGLEETRIKRHVEDHVEKHLKNVGATMRALYDEDNYSIILVGGNTNYALVVADLLKEIITGIPVEVLNNLGITDQPRAVVDAVADHALQTFVAESSNLIEGLITEHEKGGLAVAGLRGVIHASNLHAIHKLIVDSHKEIPGKRCSSCGALGLDEDLCPLCHGRMEDVEDIIDLLIYKTLCDDGDVRVIGGESPLREYEGVGATLRFLI